MPCLQVGVLLAAAVSVAVGLAPSPDPEDRSYLNPAPPAFSGYYFKRRHSHQNVFGSEHQKVFGKWDGLHVKLEDFDLACEGKGEGGCFSEEERKAMRKEELRIEKFGKKPDWDNFSGKWIEKSVTKTGEDDENYKIAHFENPCRACCACLWQSDNKEETEANDLCTWGVCPDPYPWAILNNISNGTDTNITMEHPPTFCYSKGTPPGFRSCLKDLGVCSGANAQSEVCTNCKIPKKGIVAPATCKRDKSLSGAYPSQCSAPTNMQCRYPNGWTYGPKASGESSPESKKGVSVKSKPDEEDDDDEEDEQRREELKAKESPSAVAQGMTYVG